MFYLKKISIDLSPKINFLTIVSHHWYLLIPHVYFKKGGSRCRDLETLKSKSPGTWKLVKSKENGNSSQYPLINYIDLEDEDEKEDEGVEEEDDEEGDDSCFGDDVFNSLAGLSKVPIL